VRRAWKMPLRRSVATGVGYSHTVDNRRIAA
jgi:hypothetical protein